MNNDFSDAAPQTDEDTSYWQFMEYLHEHTLNTQLSEQEIQELKQEIDASNNEDYQPKEGA